MPVSRVAVLASLASLVAISLPLAAPEAEAVLQFPNRAVDAGGAHTCVLLFTRDVDCYGLNTYGEANDYSTRDVFAVSTGYQHTCFLVDVDPVSKSGSVECQGDNWAGQSTPYPAADAVQVSAGGAHTCVLTSLYAVDCYGYIGSSPVTDPPGSDVLQVSAGLDHTCVLRIGGTVDCYGSNAYGQIFVPPVTDAVAVSAGGYHTCILRATKNVTCFGYNGAGQAEPYLGGDAVAIETGRFHTCVLKEDGDVHCYGSNGYGEAFTYTGGDALAVAAGDYHTCMLLEGGHVRCSGQQLFGQSADRPAEAPGDADRDGVPDAVEVEACSRPATRDAINNQGGALGNCAGPPTFDYTPPPAAAVVLIPTAPPVLGTDGDFDGVPSSLSLSGIEIEVDPFSVERVFVRPGVQVQGVDPDDGNPNVPAPSIVQVPVMVPVGVTPGPDSDGDLFPSTVTLSRVTVTVDRRMVFNPLLLATIQAAPPLVQGVDPDDGDPNQPALSTFTLPGTVPVVGFGPDQDNDGVPSTAVVTQSTLAFDRRLGQPGFPVSVTPVSSMSQGLDPNDADPNNPVLSTATLSVPLASTLNGVDADGDRVPGTVAITWLDVTADRRTPLNPVTTASHTTTHGVDPDDADPSDPVPFGLVDADGDFVADVAEPLVCQAQSEASAADGKCVQADGSGSDGSGTNYVPPVALVPNPWNGPL